jgi:hypothetical protein
MKRKHKKFLFLFLGLLAVSFLAYCFYPILFFQEQDEPKRILLYDRN